MLKPENTRRCQSRTRYSGGFGPCSIESLGELWCDQQGSADNPRRKWRRSTCAELMNGSLVATSLS